jgi:membrane protein involved in colicin uptake
MDKRNNNPKEKHMDPKKNQQKSNTPVTASKETPKETTPVAAAPTVVTAADGKQRSADGKLVIAEESAEAKALREAKEKEAADTEAAKKAAAEKPAKPVTPKVELKCGNPLGSAPSQHVRQGSAVHRIYEYLTLPLEKAMTVEEMAKDLHSHMPTHPFESVLTNVRVEIAASKRKRGMWVGRDAQGRYNVNIKEQNRARVLTPEEQKAKEEKQKAREAAKAERLVKLQADREAKKKAKEEAKESAEKAKAEQKAADEKLTPEQVQAELAKQGIKARVVS